MVDLPTVAEPARRVREALLAGANPFVTLYDGEQPTAYASIWRVDWSPRGSGGAVVLWHDGAVRLVGDNPDLATWLEEYFVRNFEEAAALPIWPSMRPEAAAVDVRIDPRRGCEVRAVDIVIRLGGMLDARPVAIPDFRLAGVSHGLSMLLLPCAEATIEVGGRRVPGAPRRLGTPDRPSSSACVSVHESWSR